MMSFFPAGFSVKGLFSLPRRQTPSPLDVQRPRHDAGVAELQDRVGQLEREIEELHQSEKTRQEESKRFRGVLSISPVGIFQTDADGRCVFANDRCRWICGMSTDSFLGEGWSKTLHPDDRERVLREWQTAVKEGLAFKSEYRFIHQDKEVWVLGEGVPERATDGRILGYVGAITDITDRRKAEANLSQSEARLKMALRIGRIVAWEWTAATDTMFRSGNAIEVVGLPSIDAGFPSDQFVASLHPKYHADLRLNVKHAFEGKTSLSGEYELTRRDGSLLVLASQAEVIRDARGEIEKIVGVTRDVTAWRRTQQSVENARRFLEQTLDALPSHIAILDDQARIISVNSAWRTFADCNGMSLNNHGVGMKYIEICEAACGISAEGTAKVAAALKELLEHKRSSFYFEYPCHSPSAKRWFVVRIGRFEAGGSVKYFCSHHDVTELKLTEEALRESEARFRQLADSMPQVVWAADRYGRLDYFNQKFFEKTGLSAEQANSVDVGKMILHPDDYETIRMKWYEAVEKGTPYETEARYIDARGGHRWYLARALPVRDEAGQIVRWFGTCTEIEEQKKIEQDLESARRMLMGHTANLERAVRDRTAELEKSMKQMEGFCYSIAHDLRAPLRAMQGFTTALCDDYGDAFDEQGREYASRIVTSSQRMERLIQDLLDYGRLSHIEITSEPVELEKVLNSVLRDMEAELIRRGAVINIKHPLPCVLAHQDVLEDVFGNLVSNALKFVAPGVTPSVTVRSDKLENKVRIYVEDNGIGIEPEYHERIFRVFEKIHGSASEDATGIGLAIVRKSVERLGGNVGVESRPGGGSCFWFELPACDSSSKPNA
jgi:PAS domain S-box-containing protein